ncbi:MAG: M2 family metallopeptidase [Planctomycetes bacterium]|nr:M2 family metallopeptidase [Planctomycetota bacterium]MBL7146136.1 M2 family metallopeptidase [Phycisphaerae bacterium]
MKTLSTLVIVLTISVVLFGCAHNAKEAELDKFITSHVEKIKPMAKEVSLASWAAAISGKPEDYDKVSELTLKVRQVYSNPQEFAFLKDAKESGQVTDAILARQLDVLYNNYLESQIEPELLKKIVDLGTKIEKNFSTFRGTIDGNKVTDNEIKEILKSQTDSGKRKQAWLASKQVAVEVADDIIRLVKLRNEAAGKLGFDNYHTLSLATTEQDVKEMDRIFEQLYELTNEPYAKLKAELDRILADKYGIAVAELMPWHYHDPFFQETPLVYELDLDVYYENKDVKELAEEFYAGIGLPVESILANSDLYEREGKNPHAFCTDIDREGDVRILCNIDNNEYWMEVTLHELGHAVYDKYHDLQVPFLLRKPVHAFTTEAIAMFFGRLCRNPAWMQQMLALTDRQRAEIEKVSSKYSQLKQLIFARWDMVMYNFEKQLYADPEQDLNSLWWQMVEKYQLVKRPQGRNEPDWAAKIHFTIAPCYYHNYLLGELLASQLHNHMTREILKLESDKNLSYIGRRELGDFLREKVFEAGAIYHWNEMIKRATGEYLTPEYYVEQFVK